MEHKELYSPFGQQNPAAGSKSDHLEQQTVRQQSSQGTQADTVQAILVFKCTGKGNSVLEGKARRGKGKVGFVDFVSKVYD